MDIEEPDTNSIDMDDESDLSETERDSENGSVDFNCDGGPNTFHQVSSLESICLDCISDNFRRFNFAYSTSRDSTLRLNLLFLQKRYSKHFLVNKSEEGYLDECYLNFLVNEYLKELYIGILAECDWDNVVKRIAQIGHGFQKVSFSGFTEDGNEDEALEFVNRIVCHLRNVEVLEIPSLSTDKTLKIIASFCPMLKELNVQYSKVTSDGLKVLCSEMSGVVQPKTANLKVLSLQDIPEIVDGIQYLLKHMPCLEKLDHDQLPSVLYSLYLEDSGRSNIVNDIRKFNLTTLDLNSRQVENASPIDVLKAITIICPDLKVLDLSIRNEYQLELLSQFSKLEKLNIIDESCSRFDLSCLFESIGKGLKRLKVVEFTIALPVLIRSCPKLEYLSLSHVTYQSVPDNFTEKLNSLTELLFESLESSDSVSWKPVTELMNSSPNLEKLSLRYCDFDGPGVFKTMFSQYRGNNSIKFLEFRSCNVEESELQSILTTCSSLEILNIDNCYNIDYRVDENLHQMAQSIGSKVEIIWNGDYSSDMSNSHNYDDFYHDFFDENSDIDTDGEFDCFDPDYDTDY